MDGWPCRRWEAFLLKLAHIRFTARAGVLAAVAAVGFALPAHASTTPLGSTVIAYTATSDSSCDRPAFTRALLSIGDDRWYTPAPSGDFAGGVAPGWQLRSGARLGADAGRGTSLVLPAGASAISPGMCVDLDYPHLRFAHKVVGKNASGVEIMVEVVYPRLPDPVWTEVKQFDGYQGDSVASGWRVSPDVDLKPDFGGKVPGARYVALRFTAVKKAETSAEFWVDDVLIDPRMRS